MSPELTHAPTYTPVELTPWKLPERPVKLNRSSVPDVIALAKSSVNSGLLSPWSVRPSEPAVITSLSYVVASWIPSATVPLIRLSVVVVIVP